MKKHVSDLTSAVGTCLGGHALINSAAQIDQQGEAQETLVAVCSQLHNPGGRISESEEKTNNHSDFGNGAWCCRIRR
jgi:hypothetical protein